MGGEYIKIRRSNKDNMIRGIAYTVSGEHMGRPLDVLLRWGHVKEYNWVHAVDQYEDYTDGEKVLFENYSYSCLKMEELLSTHNSIIFLKMAGLSGKTTEEIYDINHYEDYITSDYQLFVFITDVYDVEIYSKKEEVSKALYRIAQQMGYTDVSFNRRK